MFSFIPVLLLAATAVAAVQPRTALHDTEVDKVCDPNQRLVCCGKDNKCAEVKIGAHNKNDIVSSYNNCTAIVACCSFDVAIEDSHIWGDINNQCTFVGSLFGDEGKHGDH